MSHYKDEHLILSCSERQPLVDLRYRILSKIRKGFAADGEAVPDYSNYVSPVLSGLVSIEHYLFIPADCSKEGWTTSSVMDDVREWLREEAIHWNATHSDKIDIIMVSDGEDKLSVERMVKAYGDGE